MYLIIYYIICVYKFSEIEKEEFILIKTYKKYPAENLCRIFQFLFYFSAPNISSIISLIRKLSSFLLLKIPSDSRGAAIFLSRAAFE